MVKSKPKRGVRKGKKGKKMKKKSEDDTDEEEYEDDDKQAEERLERIRARMPPDEPLTDVSHHFIAVS